MLAFLRKLFRRPNREELSNNGTKSRAFARPDAAKEPRPPSESYFEHLVAGVQDYAALQKAEANIREVERAHQEERYQREQLRVTLSSIGDAVIVTDTRGNVTFLNPVAQALTGWKPEEAAGQPLDRVFRIINEETRLPVEDPVSKVLREGVTIGLANHTVLIARDGREICIDDSGAPIRGEAGAIAGVVLVFRDVTEARRAVEARLRLAAIVESSEDAIISKNLDGIVLSWNRGAERLLGYTAEEMIGQPLSRLVPPEHPDEFPAIMMRLRRGERIEHYETVRLRKDGSRVDVSLTVSPVRDAEGKIIGASKIARDITARKRSEAALRFLAESSKALAELLDVPSTLQKVAALAVPHFADWCAVDLLQPDGSLQRVAVAHVDRSKVALAHELSRRYPPNPNAGQGPWHIVRSGQSEMIHEITDAMLEERIKNEDYRRILRELGVKSYIGVPLLTRGKVLGTITFTAAESGPYYEPSDLRLAEDLGQRAAVAIENARLYSDLKAADRQLRIVTESMSTPVTRCSRDYRYLWVSKPYADWIGQPVEDIVGRPIVQVIGAKAFEQLRPYFERVLAGERVQYEEVVNFRGPGRRWINAVYTPTFDGADVPDGWVAVVLDIDERKRTEQTVRTLLRVSERLNSTLDVNELLDILVEEAIRLIGAESGFAGLRTDEGMVCHKYFQDGRYVPLEYCWPPMHGLPGWVLKHKIPYLTNNAVADPQIVQPLWTQFGVRCALCMPILSSRQEVLGFFGVHNKEGGFTPADQEKLLAVSQAASVAIQNGLAYRKVQQAEESLREADRRKDEFLAMLAHELRNPLAPIRNALHIMKMAGTDARAAEQARQMTERQVQHLVRLVDDLLDVSRIMRGRIELRKEPVKLAGVITHAVETTQPILDAQGQQINVSVPSESLWLDADATRLAQVIGNLLHNAAKFSQRAGQIWLTAERQQSEAVIRVRDEGAGIPPELLPHLFDLFVQGNLSLERSQGGLGIGLTVVRKLLELHGGKVTAHSEGPGKGSEFVVRLPLLQGRPTHPKATPSCEATRQIVSRRVLVVDDNVDAAQSIGMLLQLWGYDVSIAHTGQEVLPRAAVFQPEIVLLDIGLPGMDGYEIAKRLRQQPEFGKTVLIAVTGYGQETDRRRSKEAGFDHHLTKPVDPDVLQKLLASLPS